jgi:hypothetical protein
MGRSRGGLTTKIHALTDARGLPLDGELPDLGRPVGRSEFSAGS